MSSDSNSNIQNKINGKEEIVQLSSSSSNEIKIEINSRIKRVCPDKIDKDNRNNSNSQSQSEPFEKKVINQNEKNNQKEELVNDNLKVENLKEMTQIKKQIIYKRYIELRNIYFKEIEESKEFFLLSKKWYNEIFRQTILSHTKIEPYKDMNLNIDNNDILIEKEIFDKALFLEGEKQMINIIKPKYEFCNNIKPIKLNKKLWEFFQNTFGGGPEIKIYSQKEITPEKTIYKLENLPYIRINCIILPTKNYMYTDANDYKKDIQVFYFFFNRFKKISDLLNHLKEIIKSHPTIKIIDINNYKCWIDFNYDNLGFFLERINQKLPEIYNMNNNNDLSALNLENIEKEEEKIEKLNYFKDKNTKKFGFKLFPLNTFQNEIAMNIFPNQFTDNFEKLNKSRIEIRNIRMYMDDGSYEMNKYPELNIIIEQIVGSIFYKSSNIKYKIDKCAHCNTKGIMTIFCECGKKFYCSNICKNYNKRYHEEECPNLLLNHFLEINEKINQITDESILGIKGIRNIGNTCYMNTALQCLSNCIELRNYFLFGNPNKDINKDNVLGYKGLVAYGFQSLIKKLWLDKEKVLDISQFKNAMGICNERFWGTNQQDTHEFITFLIDALHEDLNRVKNKIYISKEGKELDDETKSKIEWNNYLRRNQSILVDLFYGIFKSTVTCQECKKPCVDFNIFSSLFLNLANFNKKPNNDFYNKIRKLNLNLTDKTINKIENDENKNKENGIKQNINNLNINIHKENISLNKTEKMDIIDSPTKKEEILVGGKEKVSENEIESSQEQVENNELIKIKIAFFLCSSEEKSIQFILPIKDKKDLSYKCLIYKISQIFNKNPYSLYLYHTDRERNIINVYGTNDCNSYDLEKGSILLISEIGSDIIRNNLNKNTNCIFYDSKIKNYNKVKFSSREKLEQFCNKNKDNIINVINEKMNKTTIVDTDLLSHYMNLEKIFQFTLKNYIFENEKNCYNYTNYPKIIVFSKNITIFNLYIEIIKRKKNIIIEYDLNNNNSKPIDIKRILNAYFKKLFITKEKFDSITIFEEANLPFYISLQKYNINNQKEEGTKYILLLNEEEQNKQIKDILNVESIDFPNEQIIINIFWNQKYNNRLRNYLRPEKLDSFFNTLIGIETKSKSNKDNLTNWDSKNNVKLTEEEFRIKMKERYDNLSEHYNNNNNNSNENYFNQNNLLNKNEKRENNNKIENYSQLKPEISIDDSFELLREEEILDENNEWFCENCKKKQKALKKIEIFNAPKILIIQIKRFNHFSKINTKVNFPLNDLDITNYILSNKNNGAIRYDLFAVANHYGSLHFGHYTAFCKNSITNKWYDYNDSMVTEIADESKIITQNAYVLFYRQKGLSKLNWNDIYNKKYINIDISNPNSLVDFNYDFIKNSRNTNIENKLNKEKIENGEDINEFDKIIKETYINKRLEKLEKNRSLINKDNDEPKISNNIENYINMNNIKDSNNFLAKKRNSSDNKE